MFVDGLSMSSEYETTNLKVNGAFFTSCALKAVSEVVVVAGFAVAGVAVGWLGVLEGVATVLSKPSP
jgi:hypothetical protein